MENLNTATQSALQKPNTEPHVDKANLKALFDTFQVAQDATELAKASVEVCKKAESDAIAALIAATGTVGPFKLPNGKIVVAVKRDSNYFFRSPRGGKLIEV